MLKEVNENTQVVLRHVKSPFPISNREVVAIRHTRTLEDGALMLLGSSINAKGVPETPGFVRANAIVAAWHVSALPEGQGCLAIRLGQVDPRGAIPHMVVNAFKQKAGTALLRLKTIVEQKN